MSGKLGFTAFGWTSPQSARWASCPTRILPFNIVKNNFRGEPGRQNEQRHNCKENRGWRQCRDHYRRVVGALSVVDRPMVTPVWLSSDVARGCEVRTQRCGLEG